mgnify:CR=1 FL=1
MPAAWVALRCVAPARAAAAAHRRRPCALVRRRVLGLNAQQKGGHDPALRQRNVADGHGRFRLMPRGHAAAVVAGRPPAHGPGQYRQSVPRSPPVAAGPAGQRHRQAIGGGKARGATPRAGCGGTGSAFVIGPVPDAGFRRRLQVRPSPGARGLPGSRGGCGHAGHDRDRPSPCGSSVRAEPRSSSSRADPSIAASTCAR